MNAIQRAQSREIWNALQQREDAEWQKWLDDKMNITYCYNGHRVTWESGVDIGADAGPFCPTCMAISPGRYVELGKPKPSDPTWDCECGAELPTTANYCGRCGKEWKPPF